MCDSVKFVTGRNVPPVLKIVTRTGRAAAIVAKHVTACSILVWFSNFDQTMGFYRSYMLLLKPPILMRSWTNVYISCFGGCVQLRFLPDFTISLLIEYCMQLCSAGVSGQRLDSRSAL